MNADEQAIRDLVALWHSATAAGDVDTVLGLMDEDVVFLVAGQPPMRGRDSFEPAQVTLNANLNPTEVIVIRLRPIPVFSVTSVSSVSSVANWR